jgi:hypothetical protein
MERKTKGETAPPPPNALKALKALQEQAALRKEK